MHLYISDIRISRRVYFGYSWGVDSLQNIMEFFACLKAMHPRTHIYVHVYERV